MTNAASPPQNTVRVFPRLLPYLRPHARTLAFGLVCLLLATPAGAFVPGLEVNDLEPTLRHEGFYSMFMRTLLGRYGANRIAQPAYLPEGILREAVDTADY